MKAPSISVVMAVYNNMPFLQLAVESILRQTYRDFEFIIIDDGSTDGGGEVLEEMAHRDSRIQLKRRENRGLTKSLNEGCALARGEFIARMDGDDVSYANRFELQIQEMTRKPEIVALGAQVRYVNESNSPLFIRHVPLVHEDIEKCHLSTWGGVVIHPVAMFRRKALPVGSPVTSRFMPVWPMASGPISVGRTVVPATAAWAMVILPVT
jgi:glycosyltransferase involved in cell wall biosynthesis